MVRWLLFPFFDCPIVLLSLQAFYLCNRREDFMNIPLFGMLAGANLLILVVWLFRCAQMRGVIEEMKAQKEARQKIDFVDIKKVRPTEGAHILVWDALEKRVIPTLYKGTKEDWEKAKDKESRFTHFLEVDPPH